MTKDEVIEWMRNNNEIPPTIFKLKQFFTDLFSGCGDDYFYMVTDDIKASEFHKLYHDNNTFKGRIVCIYSNGADMDIWGFQYENDAIIFNLYLG